MNLLGLLVIPDWLIYTSIIGVILYYYLTWNYKYWEDQNIKYEKPYPFVGSIGNVFRHTLADLDLARQKKHGTLYGLFEFRTPYLLIQDLDLAKILLIKDFNNFVDRRKMPLGGKSKLLTRQFLTNLEGDEWRSSRAILTPTFTSGKLRQMGGLMEDCAKKMVKSCHQDIKKQNGIVNIKDRIGVFTMDVIASCCFGTNIDSQDPNDTFIQHAKLLFNRNFTFVFLLMALFPKLIEIFEVSIFPDKCLLFFEQVVKKVVNFRRNEKTKRSDFLQLLLDAQEQEQKGKLLDIHGEIDEALQNGNNGPHDSYNWRSHKVLDETGLVANSVLFLLAGFDSTATTISFACHSLALNPEIQKKLQEEIDETIEKYGNLSHEVVMNYMPYLEMVVAETLRMYPIATRLERRCTRDCKLGDISIRKDMLVGVGVYAIHHDPAVYPHPEQFDPERFTAENKAQRHPMAYLPFGTGPRICIGMRFALMEAKIGLAHFLRDFTVSPCEKTEIPIKMRKGVPMLLPLNGITLKVESRH